MTLGTQRMGTQQLTVDRFVRFDGQSSPQHQSHGSINARIVREDRVTKKPDGTSVETQYVVFVDGQEDYLPTWHDRLGFTAMVGIDTQDRTMIVEVCKQRRALSGQVDHVELLCREE